MFLWHPNGVDQIEFTSYKLGIGFYEVWVPMQEEECEAPAVDCVAAQHVWVDEDVEEM